MENIYLSYLMGAEHITGNDMAVLGIEIVETKEDSDRTLKIPEDKLGQYIELIKSKLDNGFWNEIVGTREIIFYFQI